ncbi:M23 family metallopeptidase [Diaminobutyricibacter tongyongensis]|uniref:M23 family metallopeptidase n=1 Tax=Leifsonia tongyongensis TaxID=1268043 RepID=A0A6L9XZP3_9MICO|nr:M23 family metallopeptidase [Diaminobutyricibacter tongyongensis]NEN06677.1 M23 family metallopeptidase [Diaminobutyricibacter tongyongensis]
MRRHTPSRWAAAAVDLAAVAVLTSLALALPSAAAACSGDVRPHQVVRSATTASTVRADARWPWPIAPPVVVGRAFVAPATAYSAGHRGIDLTVIPGAEVRSPVDGTVTFSGVVVDRPVLTLDVGNDLLVSFEPIESVVAKGDHVARSEFIGRVADGGHCAAGCLHVGVRLRGAYISPLLFFDRVPRAVLLPLP